MKRLHLLIALLVSIGLGVAAVNAAQPKFRIPQDVDNVKDVEGAFSGVEAVTLVTSTTAALASDSGGTTITDGFIHWVILPSTADVTTGGGSFLELRSTGTANTTSARLIPRLRITENAGGVSERSQYINFRPPIPFSNGLSVNLGPLGTAPVDVEYGVGVGWKRR